MKKSFKLSLLVLVFSMVLFSCTTDEPDTVVIDPVASAIHNTVEVAASISKNAEGVIQYSFPSFTYSQDAARTIPLSKTDLTKSTLLAYVQLGSSKNWYPLPGNLEGVDYKIDYSNSTEDKTTVTIVRINGKEDQEFAALKIFAVPAGNLNDSDQGIVLNWWE